MDTVYTPPMSQGVAYGIVLGEYARVLVTKHIIDKLMQVLVSSSRWV
jgi:hypothetical protein